MKNGGGVGYARNRGYDIAQGEYIGHIDSDDYLITEEYLKVLEQLDGTDIVYMNLIDTTGRVFELNENTIYGFCGSPCKIIKRELIGDLRYPEIEAGEDWYFNNELQAKPHTRKFTNLTAYFYNFPRENSLYDKLLKQEV